MSSLAGRTPLFRLPKGIWIVSFVLTTPFFYFFMREGTHTPSPTPSENVFLVVYSVVLGLNYCLAFRNRDLIFNALPSWLVPTWRRIILYVVAACLFDTAINYLPLPLFYNDVLARSFIFLLIPYLLLANPATTSGRFLTRSLDPRKAIDPSLADSDQEIIFSYNTRKSIFLVVVSSAFVLTGLFIRHAFPVAGWAAICFFGLGLLLGILVLIPGSTCLIVNGEGFVMVHLWRRFQYRWTDVRDIELVALPAQTNAIGRHVVGFNLTDAFRQASTRWQERQGRRAWVQEMCGKDALLPSSYNVSPEDLCRVMIQRQARVVHTAP